MRSTPWCVSRAAPHYPCVARARPQAFGRSAALDAADAEQAPRCRGRPGPRASAGRLRPGPGAAPCARRRGNGSTVAQDGSVGHPTPQAEPHRRGRRPRPTVGLRRLMAATAPVSGPTEVMARAGLAPAGDRPDRRGGVPGPPDLDLQGMLGGAVQKAPVDREGADDQGRGPPPPRGPQTPVNGHKILGQRRLHASDAALYSHRTTGGTASGRIPPRDRDAGAAYGPASRTIAARKV